MTQEEKAQAYDEALNKAKIEISTKGIGETVNLCYQLFPQLAENEDENLKNKSGYYKAGKFWKASTLWNATKNKVPQRVSNRYILQECSWNIGTLQRFADEVKNVQEVSLDYPIILDMNGNIIDGAHRVVKAYLEGKDIDIVYLGDDEWPEPDYDEEKAVRESDDERIKKSLIKFLTDIKEISESGRTSWAVRKEDAEMCKSFLDYLGEQNEQKPNIELIQRSWYMEGYHDREFGKEPKWILKTGEGGPKHELNPRYGQPLTEQQVTEEQLHNLNEAIKSFRMDGFDRIADSLHSLYNILNIQRVEPAEWKVTINGEPISTENKSVDIPLAEWSEEDKKMLNHLIDKIQENLNIRMPDGHSFGISNDEKETFSSWLRCLPERFNLQPNQEWSEEDETAYNAFICEVVNEKMNPTAEQVKWLRSICDRLKFLHPQLKAEWSEEDESSLKELIHYFESLLDCLATEKGHAENRKWLKFLKSLRPQLKQEWNDEDKSILNTIIADVKFQQRKCGLGTDEWNIRSEEIQWLKNLLKRFNPQKQEWKEVELEFRGEKVKIKRPFFRDDKGREYSTTEQDEDVVWYALRAWCDKKGVSLYDLYPKYEWSEEDEIMLNNIIRCLPSKSISEFNLKRINWLKSLRPSWKPSKEQMDSLRDTIANTKGYSYSIYLPELYEQLKKLV